MKRREFAALVGGVAVACSRSATARTSANTYRLDLPVEQASKLVLALNLKTAKASGLEIDPSLRAIVDETIE